MSLRDIAITSALALAGVALWSHAASRLAAGGDFNFRPNPLGLKTSPYGAVVALATRSCLMWMREAHLEAQRSGETQREARPFGEAQTEK